MLTDQKPEGKPKERGYNQFLRATEPRIAVDALYREQVDPMNVDALKAIQSSGSVVQMASVSRFSLQVSSCTT